MAADSGGCRLGIVAGDEGKHVEVMARPEVAWICRTEAAKWVVCYCNTTPARHFRGVFPATMGFVGDGSWLGFVVDNEGDQVEVTARLEVTGGGRTEALKLGWRGGFGLFSAPARRFAARFWRRRASPAAGLGLKLKTDVQASSGWSWPGLGRPGLAGKVAGNHLRDLQNSENS